MKVAINPAVLRHEMQARGLDATNLAALAGLAPSTITSVFAGTRCNLRTGLAIRHALTAVPVIEGMADLLAPASPLRPEISIPPE